jgi:hypothetical protein
LVFGLKSSLVSSTQLAICNLIVAKLYLLLFNS